MSLFNQMIRGGYNEIGGMETAKSAIPMKPRTFRETVQDQIAFHKSKITDLEAVLESLTPEVEKFVEAIQKIG